MVVIVTEQSGVAQYCFQSSLQQHAHLTTKSRH